MNIDLLLSKKGAIGLVADRNFDSPVAGLMVDSETGILTLEFAESDPLELNIPAEESIIARLFQMPDVFAGAVTQGMITEGRRVPIFMQDDPFGGGNTGYFAIKPTRALAPFEQFLKTAITGQPIHRDDLGDEGSAGGVMGGLNPAVVQFSPQLARQHSIEMAQRAAPSTPAAAPSAPGFGPKGMGGGSSSNPVRRIINPPPRTHYTDDDE